MGGQHASQSVGDSRGRNLCCQAGFELFDHTSVRTDAQYPRGIAYPTRIEAHVNDLVLHLGQTPSVAVGKQKTSSGTRCILAQIALGAAGRFPTFDNLLTLAVGTADRDEGHGLLLTGGCDQDQAQCAINTQSISTFRTLPNERIRLYSLYWKRYFMNSDSFRLCEQEVLGYHFLNSQKNLTPLLQPYL